MVRPAGGRCYRVRIETITNWLNCIETMTSQRPYQMSPVRLKSKLNLLYIKEFKQKMIYDKRLDKQSINRYSN